MSETNRYQNGKIYKIVSDFTDNIYVGSTCCPLSKRIYQHKGNYNNYLNTNKKYVTSYELIKLGEVDIILIEDFPCDNKNQLHARERYWIEQNKDKIVNKVHPTRTKREYYNDNKEQISNRQNEDIHCDICGYHYARTRKASHFKTHEVRLAKIEENNKPKISKHSFEFLFKMDSLMLLPKSYTNIKIIE